MSSLRRYLAALLALVMLLSLFTGALGEEGIAAVEAGAEAEVLAAEAVEEEIVATEAEETVAEVGAAELPTEDEPDDEGEALGIAPEEPSDDEGEALGIAPEEPSDDEGEALGIAPEEPSDDEGAEDDAPGEEAAEEPAEGEEEDPLDLSALFASSTETEEEGYFGAPADSFPTGIDVYLEKNGFMVADGESVTTADTLQFYADMFPRDAVNPGIVWSVEIPSENEDDDDEGEGSIATEPTASISSNGLLKLSNITEATEVVVTAGTAGNADGERWTPDYYEFNLAPVRDGEEIVAFRDGQNNEYPAIIKENDEYGYTITEYYVAINGYEYIVNLEGDDFCFVELENMPALTREFRVIAYPAAEDITLLMGDQPVGEEAVIEMADTPYFTVQMEPEGVIPGFSVRDVSEEFMDEGIRARNFIAGMGEDGSVFYQITTEANGFVLAPVQGVDGYDPEAPIQTGDAVYEIRSNDGHASTYLRVTRKPGELTGFGLAEGLANPAVELGLKQVIDLQNYTMGYWGFSMDSSYETFIGKQVHLFKFEPDGAKASLSFTTRDTKIIDLSDDGIVYGKKKGTATVTVRAKGYDFAPVTLKVKVMEKAVSKVTLSGKSHFLDGTSPASAKLTAKVTPAKASTRLAWYSEDETIATVDDKGVVTATGYGSVNIHAISMDGSECEAVYGLEVCDPAVGIEVDAYWSQVIDAEEWEYEYYPLNEGTLGVGTTAELFTSTYFMSGNFDDDEGDDNDDMGGFAADDDDYGDDDDDYGDDWGEDWEDPIEYYQHRRATLKTDKAGAKIITLSGDPWNGYTVTGKKAGTARIWAVSEDGFATSDPYVIHVVKAAKTNLALTDVNGDKVAPKISFEDRLNHRPDTDGELQVVNWATAKLDAQVTPYRMESDSPDIVDVCMDEDGEWALSFNEDGYAGIATITAYMEDRVTVGTLKVAVSQPVGEIEFGVDVVEVAKGKKATLPMPYFDPVTDSTGLKWTSKDPKFAKIPKATKNEVQGVAAGEATIVATSTENPNATATLKVRVMPKAISSITIEPAPDTGALKYSTAKGKWLYRSRYEEEETQIPMAATIAPADGTSRQLAWSAKAMPAYENWTNSWAEDYAIDQDGVLHLGYGYQGIITVTAAAMDGSGKKASATLVFSDYLVDDMEIIGNSTDGGEIWLQKGELYFMGDVDFVNDGERPRFTAICNDESEYAEGWFASRELVSWTLDKAGKNAVAIRYDGDGDVYFQATKAGAGVLTATSKLTGVKKTIPIRVFDAPKSIAIDQGDEIMLHGKGDMKKLTATVTAQKKKKAAPDVYWYVLEGSDVVSIDPYTGALTALKNSGSAVIGAVPRCYDLNMYMDSYWEYDDDAYYDEELEEMIGNTHHIIEYYLPDNAKIAYADVRVVDEIVDEVQVYGAHSVAVKNTLKLSGRTFADGRLAEDQGITWSVREGDESILKVNARTGVVTGLKAGRGWVLATADGVPTANADSAPVCRFYVDVTGPIERLEILSNGNYVDFDEIDFDERWPIQLSVLVEPYMANPVVTWSSSDKKLLTVDANGVVTVAPGAKLAKNKQKFVTITATATDRTGKSRKTAKIKILVYR